MALTGRQVAQSLFGFRHLGMRPVVLVPSGWLVVVRLVAWLNVLSVADELANSSST